MIYITQLSSRSILVSFPEAI
uniref:Uncharacterized protein n=1 Tax=Anguilla anguilla TaxID=7936 RepID=A0A0E9RGR7_ANGAN